MTNHPRRFHIETESGMYLDTIGGVHASEPAIINAACSATGITKTTLTVTERDSMHHLIRVIGWAGPFGFTYAAQPTHQGKTQMTFQAAKLESARIASAAKKEYAEGQFRAFTISPADLTHCRMVAAIESARECLGALRHCSEKGPGTRHAHMVARNHVHMANAIAFASR